MYYKRATSIPYERFLSRNEVKIFTACRTVSTIEDLSNKSELSEIEVTEAITTFIAEGLIHAFDSYASAEVYNDSERPRLKVENLTPSFTSA